MCAPVGGIWSTRDFSGQTGPVPFDGVSKLDRAGTALSGIVSAKVPAKWVNRLKGCTYNVADGTVSECETTIEQTPLPDGTWAIGFGIFAASPDAPTARLGWSLPYPGVGFQAPGAPGAT